MQILRAPNDSTCRRQTSVGEVKFVEGIATEFTPEQADFFTQRQRNYTLEDIETEEEVAEAAATAQAVQVKAAADQKVAEQKIIDEQAAKEKALEEEKAAKAKEAADEQAAKAKTLREEKAARATAVAVSEFRQTIGEASFNEVRAFAKANGINAGGNKAAIIERIESYAVPPEDDENTAIEPEDSTDETPPADDQSTDEGEVTDEEETTAHIEEAVDLNEANHATLVEVAGQYNVEVEEAWSTEELRAALLADEGIQNAVAEAADAEEEETPPDGEDEKPTESDEPTEATQDASSASQSAPAATSAGQGTGAETTEKVTLPTGRDSYKDVVQWCRDNDVDDTGTKAQLLERIYADERFKK